MNGKLSAWLLGCLLLIIHGFALAQPFAYITNRNSDTVSVIDTATNTVVATVGVGDYPHAVAVNPAGTRVYVANTNANTVSVIETASNTLVATVGVGATPYGIAVNPTGTHVYVANAGDDNVSVIDAAINNVVATVPVGSFPQGVAINPAGTYVYVTNEFSNSVSVIDTVTNVVVATVGVGSHPYGIAIDPAGTHVYIGNILSNSVSVIDTATNTVVANVPGVNYPYGLAINPVGTRLYVANHQSNTLSVIDTTTNSVLATVPVGTNPYGVAVNPAGTHVYVANTNGNTVSVIDTATNAVVATVPVGSGPVAFGLFIGPSGDPTPITVTFNANGGSGPTPDSKQVTFGAAYGDLATTTRDGYTFNGWFTASTGGSLVTAATTVSTAADHTLYAQWTAFAYPLTTEAIPGAGGTVIRDPNQATYTHGTSVQLTATAYAGYAFIEWSGDLSGATNPVSITVDGPKNITANFGLTHTVTYNGNGNTSGSVPVDGNAYVQGAAVTVLGPGTLEKAGATFQSWNTAADGSGTSYAAGAQFLMPADGMTLYAQWKGNIEPIPTLSEWRLILLMGLLALLGFRAIRQQSDA